jgi:hypothetical protein
MKFIKYPSFIMILLCLLLAGCLKEEKDIRTLGWEMKLIGTWEGKSWYVQAPYVQTNMVLEIETTYFPDGTWKAIGQLVHLEYGSGIFKKNNAHASGSWKIKQGWLYHKVKSSDDPMFPVNSSWEEEIIEITETEFIYKDIEGNQSIQNRKT